MSAAPRQRHADTAKLAWVPGRMSPAAAPTCRGAVAQEQAAHIDVTLPYELLALECALAGYIKELEAEAYDFEGQALPSLERLASKVCHSVNRCTEACSPHVP